MNTSLIILTVIAALIAVPLIIALFVKNDYRIEEKIMIKKSSPDVFNYVRFVKNQELYSKWVMTDPNMKKTLTGTDGTVGFIYAWKSDDKGVGQGEQEITALTDNKKIDTVIRFIKPFEGTGYVTMLTDSVGTDATSVTWSMAGRTKYPMNIMNLFMGNMLHKDMQLSLRNLKNNLETTN